MYGAASPHDLEQSCNQIKTAINLTNPNSSCLPLSNRVLGVVAVPRRAKCRPRLRTAWRVDAVRVRELRRQGLPPSLIARAAGGSTTAASRTGSPGGGTISTFAMSLSGLPLPLRGSHILQNGTDCSHPGLRWRPERSARATRSLPAVRHARGRRADSADRDIQHVRRVLVRPAKTDRHCFAPSRALANTITHVGNIAEVERDFIRNEPERDRLDLAAGLMGTSPRPAPLATMTGSVSPASTIMCEDVYR